MDKAFKKKVIAALAYDFGVEWYKKIKLKELNVNDTKKCVIGQLTGEWTPSFNTSRPCKQLSDEEYMDAFSGGLGATNKVWKKIIKKLRKQNRVTIELEDNEVDCLRSVLGRVPGDLIASRIYRKLI